MTAGRPPTRSLQILELWISIIDRNSDLQSDSKLNSNILKNRLINSNRYMQDKESYQQPIIRLNAALETGSEHGLFVCENQVFWKLSREVITIIKSKKFKEERKNNFESAIRTIWENLRDNTWREYYNPKPISSIEIPTSLKNLLFHLPSSGKKPSWINPERIHLEDVKAGYFPVKTLKALKIHVEEQWRKNKIVILVADPAQGKTTGVSILSYWWEKEAINNIIFKFEAKQWIEIRLEFERYLEEVTIFDRVIVVIENIHLTSQLDNIQKLNKKESVNFILTSRRYEERLKLFRNSDQYAIFPLPISYSKELLRLFLSHYGTAFTKNKKLIHGLFKDNVNQNILFLLTHTIEKIGKEEIFAWDKFISELEERLLRKEDSDKYYWMWILYSLSVMRYYELDFSKSILFEIIKLYDETLSHKYLGITLTALEEQGIIHSLRYKENRYELVFHPNAAEKIKEYYSNEMKQIMGDLVEIEDKFFKFWLEKKEILDYKNLNFYLIEIEAFIRKIGLKRYNKLDLDIELWKKRIPLSGGETDNCYSFLQKSQFIALNFKQQILRKLQNDLLNESYFFQFLLNDSLEIEIPSVIPKIEGEPIKQFILSKINVKLVNLCKLFNDFQYEIDLGTTETGGYIGTDFRGYQTFYYLSLNHPKFQEEIEKHIRNLYKQEKYQSYLETIFRIPRNVLNKIDFQYIDKDLSFFEKIPFRENHHIIELEGDYFVQTTYELLELWNGPKLEELASELLETVKERIKENIPFFETEEDYFLRSKIEYWIHNVEIRDQLKEIDLITEFDREKFIEKEPDWILKRLEFFRKYNLELYKHVIKSKELKLKLTKIAKDYHDNIILKELEVRPSIYDLPRQNIEFEDIRNAKYNQLKRKIEQNPFHDWYNFLQGLLVKLKQHRMEKDQTVDKLNIQIKSLIEHLNIVRNKTSKEEYISILKTQIAETPSYKAKVIVELVNACFKLYTLDVSHLVELGFKFEEKFNIGYRTTNPFWNLGYLQLETNGKQLFIEESLKQELKIRCFQDFIKKENDKEIFIRSLIELLNKEKVNLLKFLGARSDVKNLFELLDYSQLEFSLDYLLNIELEKSDLQFYFLVEIIRKLKETDTIHKHISQLKRFNSIFLFKLYSNLSKQENYNFLRFLHEDWPVNNSFLKVCNQIGATKIANLLGKSLGILKSDEDEKIPTYYSRIGPFLIENDMSVDILTELLMKINFKSLNAGEENRIVLTIFRYLKDNKKESLIKEFPLILMNVVNEKKIQLFDLINPKEFNKLSHFNFEYLTNLISYFQQLQIEMRKEIENLVIIWNSAERSYNRLKTTQFIHIIESIWNWHDFSEETKKWDKNSREILFNYLIENLLELYKNIRCKIPTSKINENKPVFHDLLSKISSIFEIDEKIRLIRLKLDEILFNEDLSVLIFFITLLKDEFEDLIEEIFEDYEIDEWMFYYSLQIQENDFTQEQDLRKISELVIILSEVKEKLSFSFDIWFSRIIKHAPKELIFLIFEQNKLEFSKEQITRISKLKDFQNWKLKDIFLLLLKSFNTANLKNLWEEVEFFKRKKPTTSSELNYVLALLVIIKFSYKEKGIYEELILWLKSIKSSISPLYSDFEEGYKMILEVYLGMDLKFNVSKNHLTFFSVLSDPEIDFFFEDNPYTSFEDIIRYKMNPKEIWQHYWIKQRQNCLDFINHLSFDYLIRLIGDESLFEVFINDTEIQGMIVESLKYENYKTYIKNLRRFKSEYRIFIHVLSVFNKLFNSVIKQKIFDSLAKDDFIFIEELLVRYFSSDITSGLDIINQIKQYKPEIESSFILRYERDENLYGFSNSLTREIIRRSNSAGTIITDLEFARENLQDLFNHIISKTDYSTVKSYIWDSSSSSDFQEVIWYLGTLDLWKTNAVNLARELVKNTYFRDYELPFIVRHTPNAIDDRIKTEIKNELEKYDKYKNEKNHFRTKMENILLSWVNNNL